MTEQKINELKALLADDNFGKEVENLETVEQLTVAINSRGFELTEAEVEALCVSINRNSNGGELSEAELEDVAGGIAGWIIGLGCIAVCYGVGWVVGKIIKKKTGVCM